jgi:hypothetical protein
LVERSAPLSATWRSPTSAAYAGQLTFNSTPTMLGAAIEGLGSAFVLEHQAHVADGRLLRVLAD